MKLSQCLAAAVLMGVGVLGAACTDRASRETPSDAAAARDATKAGTDKALDATKAAAGKVVEHGKALAASAGAEITDGWITTKIRAKLADETGLKGSDIGVDTDDHVVTLSGSVSSAAAKARALEIAGGTEGVTRVVNRLVVR